MVLPGELAVDARARHGAGPVPAAAAGGSGVHAMSYQFMSEFMSLLSVHVMFRVQFMLLSGFSSCQFIV